MICGNPSDSEIYNKLLKGESAQACVTEPQFLSQAEYKEHGINTWLEKIKAVVANVARHSGVVVWSLGDMYATGTQFIEPTSVFSVQTFADAGLRPLWIRVWKKQNSKSSASSYKLNTNKPIQQYEYISAFSRNGEDEYNDQEYEWVSAFAGHSYKFVKRLTKDERKKWGYAGVWEMSPIKTFSESQSTQPIELPWRCIKMHSDKGAVVLDPFANVGTTLLLANRRIGDALLSRKILNSLTLSSNDGSRSRGRRRLKYELGDDCNLGADFLQFSRYFSQCKKDKILFLCMDGN